MVSARLTGYLLLPLLLLTVLAAGGSAQVTVEWIVASNPGPGRDVTTAICAWGDAVFAVGWEEHVENGTQRFVARVEAHSIRDGSLRAIRRLDLGGGVSTWLLSCAVADGVLFVVGGWEREPEVRIYVASLRADDLSVVSSALSEPITGGMSVAVVEDHVYVLGVLLGEGEDLLWLVEKRRATDLGLVKSFVYDPSPGRVVTDGYPCCVGKHPPTGLLLVVGYNSARVSWTALMLNEELELVKEIDIPMGYQVGAMCFCPRGSTYIAGIRGLAVLDPAGTVQRKLETAANVRNVGVACGNGALYVVSAVWRPHERLWSYELHIYDKDLNVLGAIPLNVSASRYRNYLRVELSGDILVVPMLKTVRVVESEQNRRDDEWVVAALRVSGLGAPRMTEVRPEIPKTGEAVTPLPARGPEWVVYVAGAGVLAILAVVVLMLFRLKQKRAPPLV